MTIVTEETTIPQKLFGLGRKTIASIMDDSGAVQIKFIPVENQNDKVSVTMRIRMHFTIDCLIDSRLFAC